MLSHRAMILLSGLIWFAIGLILLPLGLQFLVQSSTDENFTILLISLALFIGYFKGKKVLAKSAEKGCSRIRTLPNPAPLVQIYKPSYYALLGSMVLIGLAAKLLPLPVRGFIDTAIGAALIQGSLIYFKNSYL